jgi:hypothetical protein
MKQRFAVVSDRHAHSVKETLEQFASEGYRYVGHILCDDHHIVLIVELDQDQVDFRVATKDYPIVMVPERMEVWNVNDGAPTLGTPSSPNLIMDDTS